MFAFIVSKGGGILLYIAAIIAQLHSATSRLTFATFTFKSSSGRGFSRKPSSDDSSATKIALISSASCSCTIRVVHSTREHVET